MLFEKMMGKGMGQKPSNTVRCLISRSAKGDADAMFTLAKLLYWQYEKAPNGLISAEQIYELLAAAGTAGDAKLNRQIGNFCRREFKEETSQLYYANAFEKELACAVEQDTDAQYAVACHYAYGEGVSQSDEKAAFWCALAARGGHEEASKMLENFGFENNGIQIPSLEELEDLKNNFFVTDAKHELITRKLNSSRPKSVCVQDVSAGAHQRVRNGVISIISKLVGIASIAYIILSLASFIGVMLSSYSAGDGSNWIADACYSLLRTPLNLAFSWEGHDISQISSEFLLQKYAFGFFGGIVVAALLIALWFAVIPILLFVKFKLVLTLLLWYTAIVVAVLIIQKLLGKCYTYGVKFKKVPLSNSERSNLQKELEDFEETKHSYQSSCKFPKLPTPDAIPQTHGKLALYFALRNLFGKVQANPVYEFSANGSFMMGYRSYRMGRDFLKAEEYLSEAAKGDGAEAGWAAWHMAKMCREEKVPTFTIEDKDIAAAKNAEKTAKEMTESAILRNCPKSVISAENIEYLLYIKDPEILLSVGKQYLKTNPSLSEILFDEAEHAIEEIGSFGNPLRKAEWSGYPTGNMWALYNEFKEKYDACTADINEAAAISADALARAESRAKDSLDALKNDASGLKGHGLYRADQLYNSIEYSASNAIRSDYRLQKESQEMQQRRDAAKEAAIAKEIGAFDRKADAIERDINMMFGYGGYTDFERSLSGTMGDMDYLRSADFRHSAHRAIRKKAEQNYDSAQADDDE